MKYIQFQKTLIGTNPVNSSDTIEVGTYYIYSEGAPEDYINGNDIDPDDDPDLDDW